MKKHCAMVTTLCNATFSFSCLLLEECSNLLGRKLHFGYALNMHSPKGSRGTFAESPWSLLPSPFAARVASPGLRLLAPRVFMLFYAVMQPLAACVLCHASVFVDKY